jgi:hypothetical protein
MRDDDEGEPLYLGVGACHELVTTKPRRTRKAKQPIGFVHFSGPKAKPPRPVAKPQRRTRRK